MPGGPRRAYLAQLPQFVPGSSCILLLSRELLLLLLQLAFQDSNGVTLLRGLPAWGGTSVGTTTFRPIPSTPHARQPALCSRGKFSPALQDTLRASLPENRVPSLSLHLLRLSKALAEPYRVPGVLDDSCFLRQDLDELLGLPLTEHHAADRGHKCLVGQVQGPIRIRRC